MAGQVQSKDGAISAARKQKELEARAKAKADKEAAVAEQSIIDQKVAAEKIRQEAEAQAAAILEAAKDEAATIIGKAKTEKTRKTAEAKADKIQEEAEAEAEEIIAGADEKSGLFPVRLLKNYRPEGVFEIVENQESFYPGVGQVHGTKLWAGTIVRLPIAEAKRLMSNSYEVADVMVDTPQGKVRKTRTVKSPNAERADELSI